MAYTSGTTGNPKGTMLSHDAVTYTAVQNTDLFCWDYGVESVLSYLPLSHVAGQMMDVFLIMSKVAHLTSLMSFTSWTSLTSFTLT